MSNLREDTKNIQRSVGADPDGIFGPVTASLVLRALRDKDGIPSPSGEPAPASSAAIILDARTETTIATLDPKAQPLFRRFMCLAKATAATLGCDYVLISGNRTWKEQDELYAQGRSKPGKIVTNAKGGESNHNMGIAGDAGVFLGKAYLDASDPARAAKVHKACSEHAAECGLEWGGSWTSIVDLPHYQVRTGKTTSQLRTIFSQKGTVL